MTAPRVAIRVWLLERLRDQACKNGCPEYWNRAGTRARVRHTPACRQVTKLLTANRPGA